MTSATAQWHEWVYIAWSVVALAAAGRVVWRNIAEFRRLKRKGQNGARQAATQTAISSNGFRAVVALYLVLIGWSSLFTAPNPSPEATRTRTLLVSMAFALPTLVLIGAVHDERMHAIVKRKIEEEMGMATEPTITLQVQTPGSNPIMGLLRSRKFLLTVLALAQAVILEYFNVPDAIWQSVMALAGVVIAGIALEDYGEKRAEVPVMPATTPLTDDDWARLAALVATAAQASLVPTSPFSLDNPRCMCKEHAGDTPGCPVHDPEMNAMGPSEA